jgi:cytidylate kinase
MSLVIGSFEKAKKYIETHSKVNVEKTPGPSITFSRETGAGADIVSRKLVDLFRPYQKPGELEWTVFDKNLIEKILSDHNLPDRLAEFYEERKQSYLQSFVNEIFLGHSSFDVVSKTAKTILQLVNKGNVIIVGRGATIIASGNDQVFHVRLVGPFEKRVNHVMEVYDLSRSKAVEFTKKEDKVREIYFRNLFHKDINDPLLYNVIINTGLCSYDEAAELIKHAVVKKYHL